MNIHNVRDLITSVRAGKYTSVGCYPMFWLTSDGSTLSYEAVLENIWQIARAVRDQHASGWQVIAYDVNWEDPDMLCEHTNERIESAYAEDEVSK